ncbi:MAG: prepilin-type N-terminal cleavage/methylation domain-containing protein, partial [Bacilli bacterium]
MKNKGFTLVELIGVLIVLSVLFMVSLPPIIKMLKGTEAKITYSQKKLVEDSARDMALKSKEMTENNFTYCPT